MLENYIEHFPCIVFTDECRFSNDLNTENIIFHVKILEKIVCEVGLNLNQN